VVQWICLVKCSVKPHVGVYLFGIRLYLILFFLPFFLFATPFKIATYNVQNLFDNHTNGTEYKEYIPNAKHNWNKHTIEIKLNHIAEVICDVDADIIGLEEIENEVILKQLFKKLQDVGCGYSEYAITSLIKRLRSKLPKNIIQNEYGSGYKIRI